jgi:NAD-reducing hydrogenase small subunit
VDTKELPEQVDVGILEGSISNDEDLHKAREFRARCKLLLSLGDCAVNGNVPAMRNRSSSTTSSSAPTARTST